MSTASAEEALLALDALCAVFKSLGNTAGEHTVRAALTQAAREQAAWAKLEPFCVAHPEVGPSLFVNAGGGWTVQVTNEYNEWVAALDARTRLEALEAAAAWCEQQEKAK